MKLAAAILLCAGAALAAQDRQLKFTSGADTFVVSHFVSSDFDGLRSGDASKRFTVTGNLAQAACATQGFTARGHSMDFTVEDQGKQNSIIRSGLIDGSALLIFDSAEADKAQKERSERLKLPMPPARNETRHLEFASERLTYSGDADKGTLNLPMAWQLKDTATGVGTRQVKGSTVPITYEQTVDATGSSGECHFGKDQNVKMGKLETGQLNGPVHFTIVRKEAVGNGPSATVNRYTGVADSLSFDLTHTPGTVAISGHVVVDADSPEMSATFNEDLVVIELDEHNQPSKMRFGAHPAKTKATVKGGGR